MALYLQMLGVAVGIAMTTAAAGGAVLWLCGSRWLWRDTAESLIVRSFLGTAVLVLVFGWCSYLGLAASKASAVALGCAGALVLVHLWSRRGPRLVPRTGRGHVCAVLFASWTGAGIYLVPLAVGNCFSFANDTVTYVCTSEWLQGHDIGTTIRPDPHQPLAEAVASLQLMGHRMGPMFLLALVQAVLPRFLGLELFAAVMAWGLVLNAGGIYLLCRWAFRCRRMTALLAAWVAATTANPLAWSASGGFFCQVFGTAFLVAGLALLCRLVAPVRWRFGSAVLVGLIAAGLFSVYSEMVPIFAAASAGVVLMIVVRLRRSPCLRRLPFFVGSVLLTSALLANVELVRAYRALPFMRYRNFGGPDWSDGERLSFALGARAYGAPVTGPAQAACAGLGLLLLAGAIRAGVTRRAFPVACGLAVFGLMYVHYHPSRVGEAAHDGAALVRAYQATPGLEKSAAGINACVAVLAPQPRTWFAFKLCKWAFPLVLAVQGAGLDWLLRHRLGRRIGLAVAFVAAPAAAAPARTAEVTAVVATMQATLHTNKPLRSIRKLRRCLAADRRHEAYALVPSGDVWPESLVQYFLYPRPVVQGPEWWSATGAGPSQAAPQAVRPGWAFLLMRGPFFDQPAARLPCGMTLADPGRPLIVLARSPHGFEPRPGGDAFFWVGPEAVTLTVWSPAAGRTMLSFRATGDPSSPTTQPCPVLVRAAGDRLHELAARAGQTAVVTLELHCGLNVVEITCRKPGPSQKDPAPPVGLCGLRVEPAPLPTCTPGRGEAQRPFPL